MSTPPDYPLTNTLIHLLGAPGTGKYTVAEAMTGLCDMRLVDNHLINTPIFSLIHQDGKTALPKRVWSNVRTVWDAVADTMVHISPPDFNFVLTNAVFNHDDDDRAHVMNIKRVADERHGTYIPVRLLISDVEEHIKRITAPGRRGRMKETNPASPARYAAYDVLKTGLSTELTLDITHLSPTEAAHKVLTYACSQTPPRSNQRGP